VKEKDKVLVEHILESIALIQSYTEQFTKKISFHLEKNRMRSFGD
jgi:uncharacterized protein with HEPN domain